MYLRCTIYWGEYNAVDVLNREKGRSMNPLLTKKIKWGVGLKSDEIMNKKKKPIPGKGGRWWG